MIDIKLEKPVASHEGMVSVLKLKPPPGLAVFRFGLPFTTRKNADGTVETRVEPGVCLKYLEAMCPHDRGFLDALTVQDQLAAFNAIVELFLGSADPTPPA